jgi:hypothetical protein
MLSKFGLEPELLYFQQQSVEIAYIPASILRVRVVYVQDNKNSPALRRKQYYSCHFHHPHRASKLSLYPAMADNKRASESRILLLTPYSYSTSSLQIVDKLPSRGRAKSRKAAAKTKIISLERLSRPWKNPNNYVGWALFGYFEHNLVQQVS